MKIKLMFLLALFVLIVPHAHAAVDRAVMEGISSAGPGQLSAGAHFMTGSTETNVYYVYFNIGSSATSQQVMDAAQAAVQAYATGQGYTLTNGIIWPFLTGTQIQSLASTTAAYYASSTVQAMSFATPARTLNSAFQISSTRAAFTSYTVDVASTLSLASGQTGTVSLQYADDSGFTTNVKTVQSSVNGNTGTLTVGLNLTQTASAAVTGMIPAGKWVKIITANTAGTPTFTFRAAQEVLLPSS